MRHINIKVCMENQAFVDNENELREVLIKVVEKSKLNDIGSVKDANGNMVASFVIEE